MVVAARRVQKGRETVRAIKAMGGEAMFVKTDVSKAKDVQTMVKKTVDAYGRLDFSFNNSGVGGGGLVHELEEKAWDRVIDINLKGVWLCMKYQIAQMHKMVVGPLSTMHRWRVCLRHPDGRLIVQANMR